MERITVQSVKKYKEIDTHMKQIIFDLGGVLFHWNPKEVLRILKVQDPDFPENIHEITHSKIWIDFDAGLVSLNEVIHLLSEKYQRHHIEKFIHLSLEKLEPIEEGIKILSHVQSKGHQTFILSNISEEFLNILTPIHPFLKTFNGAVFSYEIRIVKPNKIIYQTLLERYTLLPENCIFIDDSPLNVQAAQDLGIDAILCQDHQKVVNELHKRNII